MEKFKDMKFLNFENSYNNCWLNSSLALVAFNRTLKRISENQKSQIESIISTYQEAITDINESDCKIRTAREKLLALQKSVFEYLQPKLKTKLGEPDSAFNALLNLLYENETIKTNLNISWLWEKNCVNCGKSSKSKLITKPIITFPKMKSFDPGNAISIYYCSCNSEQEMKLIYKELPPCVFFHFQYGVGNAKKLKMNFVMQNRTYHLCGIVTLEENSDASVRHFVTWIRDPRSNLWLECNDLNTDLVSFSDKNKPELTPEIIYMYVFESFDNLDKISNLEPHCVESEADDDDNELIDLSDEFDDAKSSIKDPCSEASVKRKNIFDENFNTDTDQSLLYSSPDSSTTKISKTALTPNVFEEIIFDGKDNVSRSCEHTHKKISKLNNEEIELNYTSPEVDDKDRSASTEETNNSEFSCIDFSNSDNNTSEESLSTTVHLPDCSPTSGNNYSSECNFSDIDKDLPISNGLTESRKVCIPKSTATEFQSVPTYVNTVNGCNFSECDIDLLSDMSGKCLSRTSVSGSANNSESDFSELHKDHISVTVAFPPHSKISASNSNKNGLLESYKGNLDTTQIPFSLSSNNKNINLESDRDHSSGSFESGSENSESDISEMHKDHPSVSYSNNSENDFLNNHSDADVPFSTYNNNNESINSESDKSEPSDNKSKNHFTAFNFIDRDEEITDLVHNVVETTFAAFLEQILIKKGHSQ